jgi:FHS family glucose/mannose:H+ symporter-like MFS transporter
MSALHSTPLAATRRNFPAAWLHAGFVLTGMITVLLGPILPSLIARLRIDNSHAGLLFTAQFASSVAGVLLSSLMLTRWGFRVCLALGFLAAAAGVSTLAYGSWDTAMVSVAVYGLGLGLIIPGTNLLVAEAGAERSAAALSLLNLAWGVGAVLFPLLAAGFLQIRHLTFLLEALAAMALVFAVWAAAFAPPNFTSRVQTAGTRPRLRLSFADVRALGVLGLLFFLYVGTENGWGGWIASYARSIHAGTATDWALAPAFFWGALLLGRAVAPAVLRNGNELRLARAGLLAATLGGIIVVMASGGFLGVTAGASLAGLGLSAVFPITIARFSSRFGQWASRYVGSMFALGGLGGATLPWLIGHASSRFGSLREALTIPLAAALMMLALFASRSIKLPVSVEASPHSE